MKPQPQRAVEAQRVPVRDDWVHEIEFQGRRVLCRLKAGRVSLAGRGGEDLTRRLHALAPALRAIPARSALLDGVAVVFDERGLSSRRRIEEALRSRDSREVVYHAFDLLELDGRDLRARPLEERKEALLGLLGRFKTGPVRYTEHITGRGAAFYREARRLGLEGVVSKRRGAPRRPGPSADWLRVKAGGALRYSRGAGRARPGSGWARPTAKARPSPPSRSRGPSSRSP